MFMDDKVIGVFPICNIGGICVHAIDYVEDKALASMNGEDPEWFAINERPLAENYVNEEYENEMESGFWFGSFFVPFSEVMRV